MGAAKGWGPTAPWLGLDTRESRRLVENVARDRRRVHDKGGARQAVYGHRRPWGDNSEKSFDSLVASVLFEMDRTAFTYLLHAGLRSQASQSGGPHPSARGSLLPCGFIHARPEKRPPESPRRRQRWMQTHRRHLWENAFVALLSWLAMGRPQNTAAARVLLETPSPQQVTLVTALRSRMSDICRPGSSVKVSGGGIAEIHSAVLGAACFLTKTRNWSQASQRR